MSRNPAMNATPAVVIDYAPDPHGGWLFAALNRSINNTLNHARPIAEGPTYYGVVDRELQRFRGAAGLGAAAIYSKPNSTMQDQVTSTDSATAAIFLSRMTRGQ